MGVNPLTQTHEPREVRYLLLSPTQLQVEEPTSETVEPLQEAHEVRPTSMPKELAGQGRHKFSYPLPF